ncbi:MAG TPA: hypothetical protein VKB35_04790, partial [Ktedonobacteraceae bacterium]|nr:hypothetical protein [Ktedonobacteraceae bacterium]
LHWHRELFRLYWKHKSKATSRKPKVAEETIALIREMAKNNRLWGAERIRGELLKLGLRVCKRTIQKYFNHARPHQGSGQQIPEPSRSALSSHHAGEKLIALPVMGGLHHDYHWTA